MRVAVGGIYHESNTFFERPTTLAEFTRRGTTRGAALIERWRGTNSEIGGFVDEAPAHRMVLVPTLMAWAMPSGPLEDMAFEELVSELLERIAGAAWVDGVLLCLHGAMATQTLQDADGEILRRVRALVGSETPIAATIDFHANTSQMMADNADILVAYDTYPHVDLRERGRECAELLARALRGEIFPTTAVAKVRVMPNILRQDTSSGPMAELLSRAHAAEQQPGVLAVSVTAGFPYADVECAGMSCVAVADGHRSHAQAAADAIAARAWELRESFDARAPQAPEAVARAIAAREGPVILVDAGDNVGGGTPGDGTVLLAELLAQHAQGAVVMITDPEAVELAIRAGVRSEVDLTVGGKTDSFHGAPLRIRGRVRLVSDGIYTNQGPMREGVTEDMGRTAVLQCEGVTLILNELKTPMWNLQQLRSLGIEPTQQRIIVVKAAVAHRAAYAPIAAEMIEVDTPGLTSPDVTRYTYHNVPRPMWPLDR